MKRNIILILAMFIFKEAAYANIKHFADVTTHSLLKTNRNLFQEGNDLIRDTTLRLMKLTRCLVVLVIITFYKCMERELVTYCLELIL